jgi:hypothetical protein
MLFTWSVSVKFIVMKFDVVNIPSLRYFLSPVLAVCLNYATSSSFLLYFVRYVNYDGVRYYITFELVIWKCCWNIGVSLLIKITNYMAPVDCLHVGQWMN